MNLNQFRVHTAWLIPLLLRHVADQNKIWLVLLNNWQPTWGIVSMRSGKGAPFVSLKENVAIVTTKTATIVTIWRDTLTSWSTSKKSKNDANSPPIAEPEILCLVPSYHANYLYYHMIHFMKVWISDLNCVGTVHSEWNCE